MAYAAVYGFDFQKALGRNKDECLEVRRLEGKSLGVCIVRKDSEEGLSMPGRCRACVDEVDSRHHISWPWLGVAIQDLGKVYKDNHFWQPPSEC